MRSWKAGPIPEGLSLRGFPVTPAPPPDSRPPARLQAFSVWCAGVDEAMCRAASPGCTCVYRATSPWCACVCRAASPVRVCVCVFTPAVTPYPESLLTRDLSSPRGPLSPRARGGGGIPPSQGWSIPPHWGLSSPGVGAVSSHQRSFSTL